LQKIFGIKNIYPSFYFETSLENIIKYSLEFFKNFNGTFKISTKRIDKNFPYKSIEINKIIGEEIVKKYNLKVDVKNPEKELFIEIHKDYTFFYNKKISGSGGFPLGSEGKGLLLFSGGFDSSVASYMIGKRGMNIDFLFINLAGDTYLQYIYRVYEKLKEYFPDSNLFVYNLDIEKLFNVREGYRQILFKAIIYKIAEEFAKKYNYDAIITGESLGQVSSQTIHSLKVLNKIINFPIFRPLIGFNKDEIIELSKKIGIYDIRAPEICEIEKHSKTKPKYKIVIEEFKKIDIDFEKEIEKINKIENIEIKEYNLILPNKENLIIVKSEDFSNYKFEKGKKYLLICKNGILSKYMSEKLRKEGIEAYYLDEKTAKRLNYI
jgi:thiamine biosynthesis protein ThiI